MFTCTEHPAGITAAVPNPRAPFRAVKKVPLICFAAKRSLMVSGAWHLSWPLLWRCNNPGGSYGGAAFAFGPQLPAFQLRDLHDGFKQLKVGL